MQRLLVQSACESFAAADITKSRSNSGASSINQSSTSASIRSKSAVHSPTTERVTALRRGLFQHRRSSSLCSISGGRGSPETLRGKYCIKRSESIHLSRTLSPLLGKAKLMVSVLNIRSNFLVGVLRPFTLLLDKAINVECLLPPWRMK